MMSTRTVSNTTYTLKVSTWDETLDWYFSHVILPYWEPVLRALADI